jgi:hypothetical protein
MLWKINLSIGFVDKNLKKIFEAKISEDRNHIKITCFPTKNNSIMLAEDLSHQFITGSHLRSH